MRSIFLGLLFVIPFQIISVPPAAAEAWSEQALDFIENTDLLSENGPLSSEERYDRQSEVWTEIEQRFRPIADAVFEGVSPNFEALTLEGPFPHAGIEADNDKTPPELFWAVGLTIKSRETTEDRIPQATGFNGPSESAMFRLDLGMALRSGKVRSNFRSIDFAPHADYYHIDERLSETAQFKALWQAFEARRDAEQAARETQPGARMFAEAYVAPPHNIGEAVEIGASDEALVEWDVESRLAEVIWHRGAHYVRLAAVAPDISEVAKAHVLALANRIDQVLETAGYYDFPNIGAGTSVQEDKAEPVVEPPRGGEVLSVELLDANPLFSEDGITLPRALKPTELIARKVPRKGTIADGVSQLIVRTELSDERAVSFEIETISDDPAAPQGSLEPLLEGRTVTLAGRHYAFALYTPPERFDAPVDVANPPQSPLVPPRDRLDSGPGIGLEIRALHIWANMDGGAAADFASLTLARPPVVLVHGLFSDPIRTWVTTFPDGASMAALLERAGFLPFLVNYQQTNGFESAGAEESGSWFYGKASRFEDNKRVVWDSPVVDPEPFVYQDGFLNQEPIRAELQMPGLTRIGGISQALEFYRGELDLAATQAIVVGHSMGGVLARVWASQDDYRRPGNFGEGDIDRLLTLNTPHHGSELVELKDAFLKAEIEGETWINWARRKLGNLMLAWIFEPEAGALRDLRPESDALTRIGETKVPAYAIATRFGAGELGNEANDPGGAYRALYSLAGTVFFNNRPMLDAFLQRRYQDWATAPGKARQTTDWRGVEGLDIGEAGNLERYARRISQSVDNSAYYWAAQRDAEYQDELRTALLYTVTARFGVAESSMGNDGERNVMSPNYLYGNMLTGSDVSFAFDDAKIAEVPEAFFTILRNLLFKNDPNNDGAVRVESQIGDVGASEVIDNVVHSYAPWDYRVQRRVLFLLRGESARFDEGGFPAAGRPLPRYLPSTELVDARVDGAEAVAWSGMVPAHARQYLEVADTSNALVLVRPVNPASTRLLACNAAAKGMNVKGKSASWGPQIGLIPIDQRYSKLWRTVADPDRRRAEIAHYNEETAKSTTTAYPGLTGRTYAKTRPLQGITSAEGPCDVLTDPDAADAEAGVMLQCHGDFFRWQNVTVNGRDVFDPTAPLDPANPAEAAVARLLANPMHVLADDTGVAEPPPYLTADYDLLAVAFPFDAYQCASGIAPSPGDPVDDCTPQPTPGVANAAFDPLRGYISPRQSDLVDALNRAVRNETGYAAGLVTHHGPETQYPKSPYVDYPILVFDPMAPDVVGDGQLYLVRMGPPGFRDIHLKRLFAEKNRAGYNVWPNPVSDAWRWTERRGFDMAQGYDPRDAANLPPYVEEAPRPSAEKVAEVAAMMALSHTTLPAEEPIYLCGATETGMTLDLVADASPTPSSEPAAPALAPTSEVELTFWNDVKDSTVPEELEVFLAAFPDSVFAPLAALRLKRLTEQGALDGMAEPETEAAAAPSITPFLYEDASGNNSDGWGMTALSDGSYVVVGSMGPKDSFSAYAWAARLDGSGQLMWQKTWPDEGEQYISDVAQLADGGLLLAIIGIPDDGPWRLGLRAITEDGQELWTHDAGLLAEDLGYANIVPLASGDLLIVTGGIAQESWDSGTRLIRLASNGSVWWDHTYALPDDDYSVDAIERDGTITALSHVWLSDDMTFQSRLLHVDDMGQVLREETLRDENAFRANSIASLPGGDMLLLGLVDSDDSGSASDVVVRRISQDGTQLWERALDYGNWEDAYSIAVLDQGQIVVGSMASEEQSGYSHAVLTWIDPDGAVLAVHKPDGIDIISGLWALPGGGFRVSGLAGDYGDGSLRFAVWPALADIPAAELMLDHRPLAN